jgi:hypothetical protein
MRDISLKAVIISSVFNFVLMVVLIFVLGAIYGVYMRSGNSGMSDEGVALAFTTSWFQYIALIAPLPAGYLAASIAKRRPYLHGLLSSSFNVLFGIFCMILLTAPTTMFLPMAVVNIVMSFLGGWLWVKRNL